MIVVLCQPQIPQNTGNVIRTCAATGFSLVLVKPLGFSLNDKYLKRAGIDYCGDVNISVVDTFEEFAKTKNNNEIHLFSSKGRKIYSQVSFSKNAILVFGSETFGFQNHFYSQWKDFLVTIPMKDNCRCLNLSNSVAIAVYETLRQHHFQFSM